MKTLIKIGLYIWRTFVLISVVLNLLFIPTLSKMPEYPSFLLWFFPICALFSSWLAGKSNDDQFWAFLYGLTTTWGAIIYYSVRWYMKSHYNIEGVTEQQKQSEFTKEKDKDDKEKGDPKIPQMETD